MKTIFMGLLATTSILSAACSRSDLIFQFADNFAVSKADDYLDLDSAQKSALKKDLQKDLAVAKKEVFPKLAAKLRSLEAEIKDKTPTAEFITEEVGEFQNELKKTTLYFKDTAIKNALTLKPAQFEHFAKEVREDNEDREDKEEVLEKMEKRYRRTFEFWIGGISNDQRDKITSFLLTHPYPSDLEIQSREHVLKQFLATAGKPEELKKFIETYSADYEVVRLPEYTTALTNHKKAFHKFVAEDFWPTLTDTQKKNLHRNLLARAAELEKLAQK